MRSPRWSENSVRNEVRCWLESAHSQMKKGVRIRTRFFNREGLFGAQKFANLVPETEDRKAHKELKALKQILRS